MSPPKLPNSEMINVHINRLWSLIFDEHLAKYTYMNGPGMH